MNFVVFPDSKKLPDQWMTSELRVETQLRVFEAFETAEAARQFHVPLNIVQLSLDCYQGLNSLMKAGSLRA